MGRDAFFNRLKYFLYSKIIHCRLVRVGSFVTVVFYEEEILWKLLHIYL